MAPTAIHFLLLKFVEVWAAYIAEGVQMGLPPMTIYSYLLVLKLSMSGLCWQGGSQRLVLKVNARLTDELLTALVALHGASYSLLILRRGALLVVALLLQLPPRLLRKLAVCAWKAWRTNPTRVTGGPRHPFKAPFSQPRQVRPHSIKPRVHTPPPISATAQAPDT
jgi:hypothetical protein